MNTYFSKRAWVFLWICLILLNVIVRIPTTPHEIEYDSFLIHYVADSISTFGHAKWWIHPLSIVGLYPYSMPSALPFYLSGVSQILSLEMEWTIWVVLLFLGIFSSFTAYLMAGAIKDDQVFKFITALVYSTSPGILFYTTWSASGRGVLLVLLPLLIYFLIKFQFFKLKYGLLTIFMLILLLATHNLFYLTIPIILSYWIALIISKIKIKLSTLFEGIVLLALFVIFFILLSVDEISINTLIFSYARYIGVYGFFAIGGFISLLFKKNKTFEESFVIIILLFLTPFLSFIKYAKFFMLPFEALLIGYGIINLIKISQNRKIALSIITIIMIISIGVAEFYQFGRTNVEGETTIAQFWAEESTFNAAIWTKSYIYKMLYTDDIFLSRRVLAYSGATMFTENNIVYPIQDNLENFNLSMRSPYSFSFYTEGPYHIENQTGLRVWEWRKLRDEGLDTVWGERIIQVRDIRYYIRNEKFESAFSISFRNKEKDKLFDNGNTSIWYFKK